MTTKIKEKVMTTNAKKLYCIACYHTNLRLQLWMVVLFITNYAYPRPWGFPEHRSFQASYTGTQQVAQSMMGV